MATLSGFLLGSEHRGPWKEVLSLRTVHAGRPDEHLEPFPAPQRPARGLCHHHGAGCAAGRRGQGPHLLGAIVLAVVGAALLLGLERLGADRA